MASTTASAVVSTRAGPTDNSSSTSPTRRATAKENITQSWAAWRQEQQQKQNHLQEPEKEDDPQTSIVTQTIAPPPSSVCVHVRNLWSQMKQSMIQAPPTAATTPTADDSRVFNSLNRHFVAKAISSQVMRDDYYDNILMKVLPPGYDLTQAMTSLTQDRKRAFLLLDLAAICKAHVELRRQFFLGNHNRHIQDRVVLEYNVALNRHKTVLDLLCRFKTRLRCNSNQDVAQIIYQQQEQQNSVALDGLVVDNMGATRKPDGYLKRIAKFTNSFAVDGPDEVKRIHSTLLNKHNNNGYYTTTTRSDCGRGYVLRLPRDKRQWEDLIQSTRAAAHSLHATLHGISLHLEYYKDDLNGLISVLLPICRDDAETQQQEFRIDVTGLSSSGGSSLTRPVQEFFHKLLELPHISLTIDASHLLVAHAGALCTRIIGFKRSGDGGGTDNKETSHNYCNTGYTMHYYIDDGCYGSLQTNGLPGHEFSPMPLKTTTTTTSTTSDDVTLVPSTVWGPTCDGLDRVCRQVMLPPLNCDDWLVFPNLGCGGFGGGLGLGTAFNGFEPPDTAYCVLGYF